MLVIFFNFASKFELNFEIWAKWEIWAQFCLSIRSPFFLVIVLEAPILFGVFSLHPQCGKFFYWDQVLKSMTWYKRLRFIYKTISYVSWFPFCYLICINWLFELTHLHRLHYTWLEYIRSCTEDPSYGFIVKWWAIHSQFMDLSNLSKIVVHYLLIERITCLGH